MGLLDKAREAIMTPGRKWLDQPWKKEIPIRRMPNSERYGIVVEARDLIETNGRCPVCGRSARVVEKWIYRILGDENAPFFDRWPEARASQCAECGLQLDQVTDAEKDAKYQRMDGGSA